MVHAGGAFGAWIAGADITGTEGTGPGGGADITGTVGTVIGGDVTAAAFGVFGGDPLERASMAEACLGASAGLAVVHEAELALTAVWRS